MTLLFWTQASNLYQSTYFWPFNLSFFFNVVSTAAQQICKPSASWGRTEDNQSGKTSRNGAMSDFNARWLTRVVKRHWHHLLIYSWRWCDVPEIWSPVTRVQYRETKNTIQKINQVSSPRPAGAQEASSASWVTTASCQQFQSLENRTCCCDIGIWTRLHMIRQNLTSSNRYEMVASTHPAPKISGSYKWFTGIFT